MRRIALALATTACALFPATAGASLGTTTVFSTTDANHAGVAQDYLAVAATSETVDGLNIYLEGTASRVMLGLYTGTTTTAQTLQRSCTVTSPATGWNRCTTNPYQVTAGATYWLAVLQPYGTSGRLTYPEGALPGGQSYLARSRGSLPATWSNANGHGLSGIGASVYADQAATPPPPPPPPPPPDTTPPGTSITGHPTDGTTSTSATFTFASTEAGSTFTCSLDGVDAACASPKTYTGLAVGWHTFVVAATDAAQNTDPTPPTFTWKIAPPVSALPGTCAVTTPNVPGGPDGAGGCFPGPSNTGVPAGTSLTSYTGPCTVTVAGTVIDAKTVNCGNLVIHAANVTVKNSLVKGNVWLDQDVPGSSSWSMTIQDSEVVGPNADVPTICCGMYTVRRVNAHGGHNGAQCENNDQYCMIADSWLHDPYAPAGVDSHLGGFLSDGSDNVTLEHNTVHCNPPANNVGGGCTGDINLIPNFADMHNVLVEANLMGASTGLSFCTYGGEKLGHHGYDVVYRDNVFQRGTNSLCGNYGPVTAFDASRSGNVWDSNHWDSGELVPPAN